MSARNYATCPQCKKRTRDEMIKKHTEIKAQYGTVSEEEYAALQADFLAWRKEHAEDGDECLAEYYEHWFEDGRFRSHYRAVCECGFEHDMVRVDEKCELT